MSRPFQESILSFRQESLRVDLGKRKSAFKVKSFTKESLPIACVGRPLNAGCVLLASGTKLSMVELETKEVVASFNRSKDAVTTLAQRADAKLLAVGNESGVIFILDNKKMSLVRTIQAHNKPVTALKFLGRSALLVSASENGQLKIWDVSTGLLHAELDSSTDYISSIWAFEENDSAFVTAGYDHKIRFWDANQQAVKDTMDLGAPIEDIVVIVELDLLAVACKSEISFWRLSDPAASPVRISPHQKTITSICLSRCKGYICTVSLDKHASLIRLSDFAVVGHVSIKSGGICVASLENDVYIVGTKSGRSICIKPIKGSGALVTAEPRLCDVPQPTMHKRRSEAASLLKKFEFSKFLDLYLDETKSSLEFIAAVGTLIRYNGLRSALTARSCQEVFQILKKCRRALNRPIYHDWCQEILSIITDLYDHTLRESEFASSLNQCEARISAQLSLNSELIKVAAMADL